MKPQGDCFFFFAHETYGVLFGIINVTTPKHGIIFLFTKKKKKKTIIFLFSMTSLRKLKCLSRKPVVNVVNYKFYIRSLLLTRTAYRIILLHVSRINFSFWGSFA